MDSCFNCHTNLNKILADLQKINNEEFEYMIYCPECGQMLVQKCPECGEPIKEGPSEKACPNSKCRCELVFCDHCGKINKGTVFKCKDKNCGKIIKTLSNVFLGNLADYSRTNVYIPQHRQTPLERDLPKCSIRADFSKSLIRSGVIYFWKKERDNSIKLVWRDISAAISDGEWGDEKSGTEIQGIKLDEIQNIEIFNQYILTSAKNKVLIHSADDGTFIRTINMQDLLNENRMESLNYKVAILGDILIAVTAANGKMRIFSVNINSNDAATEIVGRDENIDVIVDVEANPVIINGSRAYFAGYDGKVYSMYIQDNSEDLGISEFQIRIPNLDLLRMQPRFCVSQIAATSADVIYLIGYAEEETYICLWSRSMSRNTNRDFLFIGIGKKRRFLLDKISFYDNKFYVFEEMNGRPRFSYFDIATIDGKLQPLFSDFTATSSINHYYITVIHEKPYLVYMQSTNAPRMMSIYCRAMSGGNTFPNLLDRFHVCDKTELLIFENYAIVCDHDPENNNFNITLKPWKLF